MTEISPQAPVTTLRAMAYLSTASRRETPVSILDDILKKSREFNASQKVTGVLLHNNGRFFQFIEGPSAGVGQVYQRITDSRWHFGFIDLLDAPIARRHFSDWTMGFAQTPANELQKISNASWKAELDHLHRESHMSPGLTLLLGFWKRSTQPMSL
jgi:hypothetical protein